MDKNTSKILKIINEYPSIVDLDIIKEKSKVPIDDFYEIMTYLNEDNLVKFPKPGYVETTNKGKTYKSLIIMNWISENIISILALIVSIIALVRTI